jgi:WD40 repeat protein
MIELQTLVASDDRIWCVAWNPTGTLYGSICLLLQGMILIVFRLASCGSDKMIKLWGREGDGYFILELIELLKFVYRRTKLGV